MAVGEAARRPPPGPGLASWRAVVAPGEARGGPAPGAWGRTRGCWQAAAVAEGSRGVCEEPADPGHGAGSLGTECVTRAELDSRAGLDSTRELWVEFEFGGCARLVVASSAGRRV